MFLTIVLTLSAGALGLVLYLAYVLGSAVDAARDELQAMMEQPGAGMSCVGSDLADVDPETAEELRKCAEAHDRLVAHVCGGGC